MKTSDILKQLPSLPMLEPFRKSLEESMKQFGDQEVSQQRASEIETQVRTHYDQFRIKH